ncbi:hypothetical protein BP6252_04620 [Coleophoma cylindrospora]|uniref:Uncharacterized protein n=1 Tax=Coleophoma cylindrospora TaxID=1849047 RepID=A0A3D8S0Z5_9HELO|nr:hypothetical protein BP6252_04620 [Coleophoma cylindrospora]
MLSKFFLAAIAIFSGIVAAVPAGKPTGGPGIARLDVYSSYLCPNNTSVPPTDGSAGTLRTVSITENTCTQIALPFGSALTSSLTQAPKTGTAGCYVQIFTASGCGLTLDNQYHGFAFNGVGVGAHMFCANNPDIPYGAAELICA